MVAIAQLRTACVRSGPDSADCYQILPRSLDGCGRNALDARPCALSVKLWSERWQRVDAGRTRIGSEPGWQIFWAFQPTKLETFEDRQVDGLPQALKLTLPV